MYKSRFNQWEIFKNNRECEAIPILRKRLQNPETAASIQLRGRPIEVQKLENYAKRKKLTNNDIIRSRAVTPPGVQLQTLNDDTHMTDSARLAAATVSNALLVRRTGIQPCLQSPSTPGVPELVFADIHLYMTANLENGIWVPTSDEGPYLNRKTRHISHNLTEFMSDIQESCSLFKSDKPIQAGRFLRRGFTSIENVVRYEEPQIIQAILCVIVKIFNQGYLDIIVLMRRHFRDVAAHLHTKNHPLNRIFHKIYEQFCLQSVERRGFVIFLLRNISDLWEAILGRYHSESLSAKRDYFVALFLSDADKSLEGLLSRLVRECDRELMPQNFRSLVFLVILADLQLKMGRYADAEVTWQKTTERLAAKLLADTSGTSLRFSSWRGNGS